MFYCMTLFFLLSLRDQWFTKLSIVMSLGYSVTIPSPLPGCLCLWTLRVQSGPWSPQVCDQSKGPFLWNNVCYFVLFHNLPQVSEKTQYLFFSKFTFLSLIFSRFILILAKEGILSWFTHEQGSILYTD